ncbi:MAG: TIGR03790 family protein [Bryobacteraceae bacterium]
MRFLAVCLVLAALLPLAEAQQRPRLRKVAASPEAGRVLVVVNKAVGKMEGTGKTGASVWVGEYYAEKRGIPAANILYLDIPSTDDPFAWDSWHLPHARYEEFIRQPLLKKLRSYPPDQRILYIVTTFGVPSHLQSFPNVPGEGWSVDSCIAGLEAPNQQWRMVNPYRAALSQTPAHFENWQNPAGWPMYLVTRLDGPTPVIAAGLVDKAMQAEQTLRSTDGAGYYDFRHVACCDAYYQGDLTFLNAYNLSAKRGFRSVLNDQSQTKGMIKGAPDTLWAWGWYSGPAVNDVYQFVNGAVGAQLTSYTAEGIRIPRPGAWVELWLRRGITATWGATTEPTLSGYAMGDNLLSRFWSGYNFAESAYLASPFLFHTMVFLGDPLYAPRVFRQ